MRALSYVLEVDRDGDASAGPLVVRVDVENLDPDDHCETCIRIDYNPSIVGKAGLAWKTAQPLDVQGAKRVVLFAKGQFGGEEVNFKFLGKQTGPTSSIADDLLFDNIDFAAQSGTLVLSSNWNEYHIDLPTLDTQEFIDVTHLFAVEIDDGGGARPVTILMKGFLFDEGTPTFAEAEQIEAVVDLSTEALEN